MLLMVKIVIRGKIYYTFSQYEKSNNKYIKNYYENKYSSYFQYWVVNSFYGWAMSQNARVKNVLKIFFNLVRVL